MHFLSPSLKNKKNPPRKKFLIFKEKQVSGSNIEKFQETATPPKIHDISGNGNSKKASYISGNGTLYFLAQAQKIKKSTRENFLDYNIKIFLIFSQRKLFLYFRKQKLLKNLLYFRKQNFRIFQEELPKPQKPKLLIFLQKTLCKNFFRNSFGL